MGVFVAEDFRQEVLDLLADLKPSTVAEVEELLPVIIATIRDLEDFKLGVLVPAARTLQPRVPLARLQELCGGLSRSGIQKWIRQSQERFGWK